MPQTRIGISGWRYLPWRGTFYPKGLQQRLELEYASNVFTTIEINGTFYSLQRPSSFQLWHDTTPKNFVFSAKGPRYITHMRKLNQVEEPLANFLASGILCLKEKLGPILWQLPPNFAFNPERFDTFFKLLPRNTAAAAKLATKHTEKLKGRAWTKTDKNRPLRHAVEVRHHSFHCDEVIQLCRKHNIAIVIADTAGKWPYIDDITADFLYLRLHGHEELYVSGYTEAGLDLWSKRIRKWQKARDVYVYFDNDAKVKSPRDAENLSRKLGLQARNPADIPAVPEDAGGPAREQWPATQKNPRPKKPPTKK